MPMTQTVEREKTVGAILGMDDETFSKAESYIEFLLEQERREDEDDAAYAEAHKNEPTVPIRQALRELGLE